MGISVQAVALLYSDRRADQAADFLFNGRSVHLAYIAVSDNGTAFKFQRNVYAGKGGKQGDQDQGKRNEEENLFLAAKVFYFYIRIIFLCLLSLL